MSLENVFEYNFLLKIVNFVFFVAFVRLLLWVFFALIRFISDEVFSLLRYNAV